MKIAHTADIHIRGLDRHDEYYEILNYFVEDCERRKVDVAILAGDIFHTKTNITPEYVQFLNWFFVALSNVCDVIITLGNHDGNLINLSRQDAVTPIVSALNISNIRLYKDSGVFPIRPGFNVCVFSIFDEKNWDKVKPIPGEVNIATYHGGVVGSTTNSWIVESEITPEKFKDYDICLLGDIHKLQYLDKKNGVPWIAYPGTLVQQNYDESKDHYYLLWDIRSKTDWSVTECPVPNINPFVTIDLQQNVSVTNQIKKEKEGSRFRIRHSFPISQSDVNSIKNELAYLSPKEVVFQSLVKRNQNSIISEGKEIKKNDLKEPSVICKLICDYHENAGRKIEEETRNSILEKLKKYCRLYSDSLGQFCSRWKLQKMTWDNTFSYEKNNEIDFQNMKGVIGIIGPNKSGKSSIVGTLLYTLFNSSDRGSIKNLHICNKNENYCNGTVIFEANNSTYKVERITSKKTDKKGTSATTNLNFFKVNEKEEVVDLCEETRTETEKVIQRLIGNADDFCLTNISSQFDGSNFINSGSTKRKQIVSRHFGLDVMQYVYEQASKDLSAIKNSIKLISSKINDEDCSKSDEIIQKRQEMLESVKLKTNQLTNLIKDLEFKLKDLTISDNLTKFQQQNKQIKQLEKQRKEIEIAIKDVSNEIAKSDEIISVLSNELTFIEDETVIKDIITAIDQIVANNSKIDSNITDCKKKLNVISKNIEILNDVPCKGINEFSSCQFIKNAHGSQLEFDNTRNLFQSLEAERKKSESDLSSFPKRNELIKKLARRNEIEKSIFVNTTTISAKRERLQDLQTKLTSLCSDIEILNEQLQIFDIAKYENAQQEIENLNEQIRTISKKIDTSNNLTIEIAKEIGKLQTEKLLNEKLVKEKDEYLLESVSLEFIVSSLNKKSLPVKIIDTQLPIINDMINDLLKDVVDFKVFLAHDVETDQLEVFVNYDDSPILVELCSGMEKTISSIAIRVALSQISQLPQANFLIIDEGFGTLDGNGIESCNRFVKSLTNIFDFIFVISHIDSVKDAADSYIEIQKNASGRSKVIC